MDLCMSLYLSKALKTFTFENWYLNQARSYHYAKKPGLAHYFVKRSLNVANYAPYRAYDNVRDSLEKLV